MTQRVRSSQRGTLTPAERRRTQQAFQDVEANKADIIQEARVRLTASRERLAFLREAREQAGLSLEQVAAKMRMDKSNLSKLETAGNPTLATLERYAEAIGQRLVLTLESVEE